MRHGLEFLEYLNLTIKQYLINVILEHLEINDLDSNWLIGVIIASLVDMAGVTLANDIVETVGIVFYFLAGVAVAHCFLFGLEFDEEIIFNK